MILDVASSFQFHTSKFCLKSFVLFLSFFRALSTFNPRQVKFVFIYICNCHLIIEV